MKKTAPFADTNAKKDDEKRERLRKDQLIREASMSKLVANADFKEWMFRTLFTLCAFENEMRDTTEFERGIRAAGSLIRRELLKADGAPQFFADLDRRYWEGIRRGIMTASEGRDDVR